jgi:hypothetical protein
MSVPKLQRKVLFLTQKYFSKEEIEKCVYYTKERFPSFDEKMILKILCSMNSTSSIIQSPRDMYNDIFLLKKAFIENTPPLPETLDNLKRYGIRLIEYENVKLYSYFDPNSQSERSDFSDYERFTCLGAAAIPLLDKEQLKKYQKEFIETLREFPEYLRDSDNPDLDGNGNPISYVLGGFAALGNPGSFHNPMSRKLRMLGFEAIKNFVEENIAKVYPEGTQHPTILQALSDRMMYRMKGQKPVAEAWHRDVMNTDRIEPTDEIYGGWINLDSVDQYFSFIPGSHLSETQYHLKEGFATLEKECERKYNFQVGGESENHPYTKESYKVILKITDKLKYRLTVPPGHIVIFPQYIMHEVVANPAAYNMMRQFTGWRLTTVDKPIYPLEMFDEQAVIPLPGGMIPPMYAQNHIMYFQEKQLTIHSGIKYNLSEWSMATFKPELLVKNAKGKWIIPRHMKSLKLTDLKMYPSYSLKEKSIYIGQPLKIHRVGDEFILSEDEESTYFEY